MGITSFIHNFAEQFENTDSSLFTAETKYKELEEWSSLAALLIIAMVDEQYDVKIKGEDIRNSATIQELYTIIESRK